MTGRLSWFGIFRLGLVQTALGAVVVLTTSTLNRVMVVEWALPATLPGLLVGLHYAVQISRARYLNSIVQPHQQARQCRRQRPFNHHDSVQRRSREHHHRAQSRLHQTQPENPEPAQPAGHYAPTCDTPRTANAEINIPST